MARRAAASLRHSAMVLMVVFTAVVSYGVSVLTERVAVPDWWTAPPVTPVVSAEGGADIVDEPSIHVRVKPSLPVRVTAWVDGEEVQRGTMEAGKSVTWSGVHAVVLDVAEMSRVTVHFNGDRLRPLGRSDIGRRLEFVSDLRREPVLATDEAAAPASPGGQ